MTEYKSRHTEPRLTSPHQLLSMTLIGSSLLLLRRRGSYRDPTCITSNNTTPYLRAPTKGCYHSDNTDV